MKYFKNTELAKLYHVSEKSVRNWIEATQLGKLDLQLYDQGGRPFVANTPQNLAIIERQVERGKKFKNTRGLKTISPSPKFYETYSPKQIFDIISNITIHSEIPLQYSYADGGATFWDSYATRLADEEVPNILTSTIDLLQANLDDIDRYIGDHKKINVIDLGPGNGLPVRDLLDHLLKQGRLQRYIAIDISKEIIQVTEQHIREWFGDAVAFEGYVRDFGTERFDDLFADDYANSDDEIPLNLVLLLSGTICNFRLPGQALQTINSSLGLNDLLIYTTKLDTPNSRRYFDLGIESRPRPQDFLFHILIDQLNLKESFYELDQIYDEQKRTRAINMRPTVDLEIQFELSKGTRIVQLRKNEPILLWRYWHFDTLDVVNQFDDNGFTLMQAVKSRDHEYLLMVSKIKTGL